MTTLNWIHKILEIGCAVTVQSNGAVDLLSNRDFFGVVSITIGTLIAYCHTWITISLSLTNRKGESRRCSDGHKWGKRRNQGITATSLPQSTRCYWTITCLGVGKDCSAGVDRYGGGSGIVIIFFSGNRTYGYAVAIWCLGHFPSIIGNGRWVAVWAANTYCFFISGINILFCGDSSCSSIDGKIGTRIVTRTSWSFQSACRNGSAWWRKRVGEEWDRAWCYSYEWWWRRIRNCLIY